MNKETEFIKCELLDNGIKCCWHLTSPMGANFEIYPVKGRNTQEDIVKARAEIRENHNVACIVVKWITQEEFIALEANLHPNDQINTMMNVDLNKRLFMS